MVSHHSDDNVIIMMSCSINLISGSMQVLESVHAIEHQCSITQAISWAYSLELSVRIKTIVATIMPAILVLCATVQDAHGVPLWQTRYDADGILVQTHPKEDSSVPVFRAQVDVESDA